MVNCEWSASGRMDGKMMKAAMFADSGFRGCPIDGVTITKYGQDDNSNNCMFD